MHRTPQDLADALAAQFAAGYGRVEPPVLQPADLFLDLSGEDIRRRMFVTTDAGGARMVPAARIHHPRGACLSRPPGPASRRRSAYRRAGVPAPRRREPASSCRPASEFRPAPTSRPPTPRCWPWRIEAVRRCGSPSPTIRMGDAGLFAALLDALACRRSGGVSSGAPMRTGKPRRRWPPTSSGPETGAGGGMPGFLRAVEGQDPPGGRAPRGGRAQHRRHPTDRRPQRRRRSPSASSAGGRGGRRGRRRARGRRGAAPLRRDRGRSRRRLGRDAGAGGRSAARLSRGARRLRRPHRLHRGARGRRRHRRASRRRSAAGSTIIPASSSRSATDAQGGARAASRWSAAAAMTG